MITIKFSFIILCLSSASSWTPMILEYALSRIFRPFPYVYFKEVRPKKLLRSLPLLSYERSQNVTSKGFFYRLAMDNFLLFTSWFPIQSLFACLSSAKDFRGQIRDLFFLMHKLVTCQFWPLLLRIFYFWAWGRLNGYRPWLFPPSSREMLYFPF